MSRPSTSRIAFDPANDADNEDDEPMDVMESDGETSSQSSRSFEVTFSPEIWLVNNLSDPAFVQQRLSDSSDTPIAAYVAGGEKLFHSKVSRK